MAMKDWEKSFNSIEGRFYVWVNKEKRTHHVDVTYYNNLELYPEVKDHWEVEIYTEEVQTKYFKTKSQALSYAKSYMRSH